MTTTKAYLLLLGILLLTLISCQKKTTDLLQESANKTTPLAKKADTHYFDIGYIGTEIIDSTSEMVAMAPMFEMMMEKEGNTKFMIKDGKALEYKTDVAGTLTSFSIYNMKTKMKETFGELDMEKVYTVYDMSQSGSGEDLSEGGKVTQLETDKKIHGFACKQANLDNDKMKMEMFYTTDFLIHQNLPDGSSFEGFPLEVNLIMEGVKFVSGVKAYSTTLPHPEFFEVDKTMYREIPNEDFPKKKSMF